MNSTRWALLIGVNGYRPAIGQLQYSISDARNVEQVLNSRTEGFGTTESTLLTDEPDELQPTKVNIIDNVIRICKNAKNSDTILIYFSGHGAIGEEKKCYLLPLDASPASIEQTAIPWYWFRDRLEESCAKNKIIIIDACHSGAGKDPADAAHSSFQVIERIEHNTTEGFICLCSCSGGQLSYELPDLEQSIFSHYLVKGISGAADPLHHDVNIESLYVFVRDRTLYHARQMGVEQEPYLISKVTAPLSSFTICAAPLDRPINRVLVLTEDPFLGLLVKTGIQMSGLARDAGWAGDIQQAIDVVEKRFEYDAVYIDVRTDWKQKKEFIQKIRRQYPIVPFVLIGSRSGFLQTLEEDERKKYSHYFFFDVNTPIDRVPTTIKDTLGGVMWDIRTRFGGR